MLCIGAIAVLLLMGQVLKPAFEVASVKLAACDQSYSPEPGARIVLGFGPSSFRPGGRYTACSSLKNIIVHAFQTEAPLVTGPGWISNTAFQIDARAEESAGQDQMRLMVQTLLEERFKLKFHRESRETRVYSLVVAKGGPKLQEAKDENGNLIITPPNKAPSLSSLAGPKWIELSGFAMTMKQFADALFSAVGRTVVDNTGLAGLYDIKLRYESDLLNPEAIAKASAANPIIIPSPEAPSVSRAVQAQLGLELKPEKFSLEYIVIDSVDRPSEN